MRIGVLTGGGDCPGLNAVIRAVVRKGVGVHGHEFVGFRDGWRGPLEGLTMAARHRRRCAASCRAAAPSSARRGPTRSRSRAASSGSRRTSPRDGVDALIAIGGEDTLGVATKLADLGVNVVGVPKTIDNDLSATDYTFGFDTAVNIAMEAIDRLHTTAESHHRVLVVEVMGRHAGWIALHAGHRRRRQRDPDPRAAVRHRRGLRATSRTASRRQYAPIVVVAEGAVPVEGGDMTLVTGELDAFGHVRLGGIGERLAERDRGRAPARRPAPSCSATSSAAARPPRSTGGWPPASACTRSTRSPSGDFGKMVALRGTDIVRVPLVEATGELKLVSPEEYAEAEVFFG